MKRIKDYWVDDRDNKWHKNLFTEEQAEAESKSLINCYNCESCANCESCSDCINCENCYGCINCANLAGIKLMTNAKGKHRREYE